MPADGFINVNDKDVPVGDPSAAFAAVVYCRRSAGQADADVSDGCGDLNGREVFKMPTAGTPPRLPPTCCWARAGTACSFGVACPLPATWVRRPPGRPGRQDLEGMKRRWRPSRRKVEVKVPPSSIEHFGIHRPPGEYLPADSRGCSPSGKAASPQKRPGRW
jgi:hypothetical protein